MISDIQRRDLRLDIVASTMAKFYQNLLERFLADNMNIYVLLDEFLVFIFIHTIKSKNCNSSINEVKNLGYYRQWLLYKKPHQDLGLGLYGFPSGCYSQIVKS